MSRREDRAARALASTGEAHAAIGRLIGAVSAAGAPEVEALAAAWRADLGRHFVPAA